MVRMSGRGATRMAVLLGAWVAASPGTAWGQPAAPPTSGDEEAVDLEHDLLTIEEQVDSLKERVFRSKATLQLLREIVIESAASGARTSVWHVNKLGTGWTLEAVTYLLDGQSRFSKSDPGGSLNGTPELKVHEGPIAPGDHTLSVDFKVRPTGFGVFKYARSYQIDVRSTFDFSVEVGRSCTVRAVLTDRGGAVKALEERARVDYELKCERISDADAQ